MIKRSERNGSAFEDERFGDNRGIRCDLFCGNVCPRDDGDDSDSFFDVAVCERDDHGRADYALYGKSAETMGTVHPRNDCTDDYVRNGTYLYCVDSWIGTDVDCRSSATTRRMQII